MSGNENKELVTYRMNKALETIADVNILISNKIWNTAINRMYYACFYAVSGLLASIKVYPKSHSGTQQMFNLHFIKTGLVDGTRGAFYSTILGMRQDADYEDFIDYDENDVIEMLLPTQQFIAVIHHLLKDTV